MEAPWRFSVHALSRSASRFGLVLDMGCQAKLSNVLNSPDAVLVTEEAGRSLFEIPFFGKKVIAVCNKEARSVITFLEAKRWYRSRLTRKRKNYGPKNKDSWSGEEE